MKFENLSSIMETNKVISLPQKKYYRQRAHSNPVADHCIDYPIKPELFNWSSLFPDSNSPVEFLDVGCGYGGLLVTLSPMFPNTNILGLEIRVKVSDYVIDRIRALRSQNPQQYKNIACLRTNAMKYLPNYFRKGQLKKMFFLYPDPHFKRAKHKWRIINKFLLSEYAYVLSENALVYTITDVLELHNWMEEKLSEHPLFEKVSEKEQNSDPIVSKLYDCTEEGQKVTRNNGEKYMSVYRRIIEK